MLVTFEVSQPDKADKSTKEERENIQLMLVTFEVSQPDKADKSTKEEQP